MVAGGGNIHHRGGMDPSRYGYVSYFELFEQGVLIVQSSTCCSRKTNDKTIQIGFEAGEGYMGRIGKTLPYMHWD